MEISMNLLPPCFTHIISYIIVDSPAVFPLSIPVIVDMGCRINSHIDKNPKVCKNLQRSNWFPGKLIIGVMESDVWSS